MLSSRQKKTSNKEQEDQSCPLFYEALTNGQLDLRLRNDNLKKMAVHVCRVVLSYDFKHQLIICNFLMDVSKICVSKI